MRKPLIAGNWKMNKFIKESMQLAIKIKYSCLNITEPDIVLFPVYTALKSVSEVIKDTNIKLGAQNIYPKNSGAYTGEVSSAMIKDCGCEYVIIGHSERRHILKESDEFINQKVKAAVAEGLKVILCVGETLEQRESNSTNTVVETQVINGLKDIGFNQINSVIIAYEPVWAIGTGKTATPDQAQQVHSFIREILTTKYNSDVANSIRILYGGSVKPENISQLMKEEDIDGGLVGGASLDASDFVKIIKYEK